MVTGWRPDTIWSKLAAMLSRFCQPLFYGIGAGGGTYWSTLLVSRWFSPSTCWDINRPPWQLYQEGESHGCGGAFWWHLGLGVFRCFWWHLHHCLKAAQTTSIFFPCTSIHFSLQLSAFSCCFFSVFVSQIFSNWLVTSPFIPSSQQPKGWAAGGPSGSWLPPMAAR